MTTTLESVVEVKLSRRQVIDLLSLFGDEAPSVLDACGAPSPVSSADRLQEIQWALVAALRTS